MTHYTTLFNPLANSDSNEPTSWLEDLLTDPQVATAQGADLDSLTRAFYFCNILDASQTNRIQWGLDNFKEALPDLVAEGFDIPFELSAPPHTLYTLGSRDGVEKIKQIMNTLAAPEPNGIHVETGYYRPYLNMAFSDTETDYFNTPIPMGWLESHTGTLTFAGRGYNVFKQMSQALRPS